MGEVLIDVLVPRSHCIVHGATTPQLGSAAAVGAPTMAAPIAAIALIVVLALREAPLQGSAREPAGARAPAPGR